MDRSLTRQHRRARELVAYHLELFGACLNPALPKYRDPELEARRLSLDGLGPPGLVVCTPGSGMIRMPSVSVCYQVSTGSSRSKPTPTCSTARHSQPPGGGARSTCDHDRAGAWRLIFSGVLPRNRSRIAEWPLCPITIRSASSCCRRGSSCRRSSNAHGALRPPTPR